METNEVVSLLSHFSIPEADYSVEQNPSGFIHTSGIVSVGGKPHYILQKFNTEIFWEPLAVYDNFKLVSSLLTDPAYHHFDWVLTKDDQAYFQDKEGQLWRLLSFVSLSTELKKIQSHQQAHSCGRVLGLFHRQVALGDATSLKVTIPSFQDLQPRWQALELALQTGIAARIAKIRTADLHLEQLRAYTLEEPSELPFRICHNDTKLSNILFHKDTHEGLCLVDLDTLMPGFFFHDFGDLARCVMSPYSEEGQALKEQRLNIAFFTAMLSGIKASGVKIHEKERSSLTYGLISMPFQHGIRALTDYLLGDRYYKVSHPEQNRYRAMNLLAFAKECLLQKEEIDQQVRSIL